jgi:hypothetical protein
LVKPPALFSGSCPRGGRCRCPLYPAKVKYPARLAAWDDRWERWYDRRIAPTRFGRLYARHHRRVVAGASLGKVLAGAVLLAMVAASAATTGDVAGAVVLGTLAALFLMGGAALRRSGRL